MIVKKERVIFTSQIVYPKICLTIKQQNRNNNWRTETNRRNTQPYKKNTFNKGRSQDKTPEKLKTESKPKIEEKQPEKSGDETTETIDLSVDEGR